MSQVIASRKTAAGAILVQKICGDCRHAFWSGHNDHKAKCADCDPTPRHEHSQGIGRNMDRKRSDRQYHGSNVD